MTEKEFRKLRRHDLLQLLVAQGKENIRLQEEFDETNKALALAQETNERLKARLNEKDALIEKLKGRLDQKDARIQKLRKDMEAWRSSRQIQLVEAGSIAEAALRLNGIFEVAQQAADQYLYNLRVQCGFEEAEPPMELEEDEPEEDEDILAIGSPEADVSGGTEAGPEEEPEAAKRDAGAEKAHEGGLEREGPGGTGTDISGKAVQCV